MKWGFIAVAAVMLIVGAYASTEPILKVDRCLDHGGAWDYGQAICQYRE